MRDQELYFSIYLGIVVQNNDPEHRGRIKVWVPYITNNVYNKWNQLKTDQTFAVPGSPGGENLSNILPQLRDELPWAEFVSPIIGQSATGYYNAASDTNSVSDAPLIFGQPGTNFSNTASANSLDPENKGGKPGAVYESNPVSDAFGNTSKILSQYANENSSTYKPSTYSNAAKGVFSIPNVGAHVWVFFKTVCQCIQDILVLHSVKKILTVYLSLEMVLILIIPVYMKIRAPMLHQITLPTVIRWLSTSAVQQ